MGLSIINHRNELDNVAIPSTTATYFPLPHREALEITEEEFKIAGLEIVKEKITLGQNGLVMAAEWHVEPENFEARTSHDVKVILLNGNTRKHTMRVGFGANCVVCQNGMFVAEHSIKRKHTRFILRDLPERIASLIDASGNWYVDFMSFLDDLKDFEPRREYVNDMLVKSMEAGVIASSHIKKVLKIFNTPTFEEYGQDSLYTLHSGYTEVLRDAASPMEISNKTITLNDMMNQIANNTHARRLRMV